MKIIEIKDPVVFIALKRLSTYLIDAIWNTDIGSGEVEAEFELAKTRSKRYKSDIEKLAQIDIDLNWGDKKTVTDKTHWSTAHEGDFNPWYDGDLTLEAFLNSLEDLFNFIESGDERIDESEFLHYYSFLKNYGGLNVKPHSIDDDIGKLKTILIDVSTGVSRIQEKNDEYQRLYRVVDEYYRDNKLKNPNRFSDLWEFYSFWKRNLKSYADRRAYVAKTYKVIPKSEGIVIIKSGYRMYVNIDRLTELKRLKNKKYDLAKLIRYCEELNMAFENKLFLSTAILARSILDHVPPLFGYTTFTEVANNHGPKSFKESMKNLDNSLRKIADAFLHTQIRSRETLPTLTQVDFSSDMDVLLGEVCRLLKS